MRVGQSVLLPSFSVYVVQYHQLAFGGPSISLSARLHLSEYTTSLYIFSLINSIGGTIVSRSNDAQIACDVLQIKHVELQHQP